MAHKIKTGIIGSTGYAGGELVRLLLAHPQVDIMWLGSHSYAGKEFSTMFPNTLNHIDVNCVDDSKEVMRLAKGVDVIFTATPHGLCASLVGDGLLEHTKVIDLSADFRLKSTDVFSAWYGINHPAPAFLDEAAYGLCEMHREQVKCARLVANPGCYPTCSFLTVHPFIKEHIIDPKTLIINAVSGTSGAGRGAKVDNLFCEVNENFRAYGVGNHRHTPEIEQELSLCAGEDIKISFTPHLAPMNRGILITAYANLQQDIRQEHLRAVYEKYYGGEHFIRILPMGRPPQTRMVMGSNFVDVNAVADSRTGRLIMMGAMDNLVKGAAGQALQNMNIMFGLDERTGLEQIPMFM